MPSFEELNAEAKRFARENAAERLKERACELGVDDDLQTWTRNTAPDITAKYGFSRLKVIATQVEDSQEGAINLSYWGVVEVDEFLDKNPEILKRSSGFPGLKGKKYEFKVDHSIMNVSGQADDVGMLGLLQGFIFEKIAGIEQELLQSAIKFAEESYATIKAEKKLLKQDSEEVDAAVKDFDFDERGRIL